MSDKDSAAFERSKEQIASGYPNTTPCSPDRSEEMFTEPNSIFRNNFQQQPDQSTENYLIHMSKAALDLLNARAYGHWFFTTHVSHNVYTEFQGKCSTGRKQFINNYKMDADRSSAFHVDVVNSSAMVDEEAGSATVILSQHLKGYGNQMEGMGQAGTILMSWRRAKQRWYCGSVCMMYGTPVFLA